MANFTRDPESHSGPAYCSALGEAETPTAATLSWTFYQISNYPEIWAKLRREVLDVVGPDREPTYDDLKNLKYLTYTLNETLRLYPSVPFNVRYALNDTSLPQQRYPGAPDAHEHRRRRRHLLRHDRHAAPPGPVPAAVGEVRSRRGVQPGPVGGLAAQGVAVRAVQRRAADLRGAELRHDGDGVCDGAAGAEVREGRV